MKTLKLHTEFTFDSAHYIEGYNGKCRGIHGHTWKVEIWIKGRTDQIDRTGILFDFTAVGKIKEKLDHTLLNEKLSFNPTAENLAQFVYSELKTINQNLEYRVRLYETCVEKKTWCEYGDF